jgi:hypothetical protein
MSKPYIVIFNFIGYFILVLCDLPHVQISQVLSLCYAIPTSLLLSQDSGLVCFLLILLPATLTVKMDKPEYFKIRIFPSKDTIKKNEK